MAFVYGNDDPSKVYIIYHKETLMRLGGELRSKLYSSKRAASYALTMAVKAGRAKREDWEITDVKNFNENVDYMVETTNLMNPGSKVMIRKSELGGCTDPGTERYHTM